MNCKIELHTSKSALILIPEPQINKTMKNIAKKVYYLIVFILCT